jgi:hypothetical protein
MNLNLFVKNKAFKKFRIIFSSIFIFLIHFPFVFAKGKLRTNSLNKTLQVPITALTDSIIKPIGQLVTDSLSIYDSLKLRTYGLSKQVFDYSIKGFHKMVDAGKIMNSKIISIVDFSQPSANKRLYVIDLEKKEILFNTYVAHGKNSGQEMATAFSNTPTSNKSSLGFYVTSHTYNGKNGFSLQLEGQEKGINDNALDRGIVMHAADYVNEQYIQSQGWIGRSQGCPAVMPELNKPIVETIKEGSCFFIYYPDPNYLERSAILN